MVIVGPSFVVSSAGDHISPVRANSPSFSSATSHWLSTSSIAVSGLGANEHTSRQYIPDLPPLATHFFRTTHSSSAEGSRPIMSRESRHVLVIGIPDAASEERISSFFSMFGRVQKTERLIAGVGGGCVVSFMDVRSAQKAHQAEPKFEGHPLRIAFHEQCKNSLMNSTVASVSAGSPQGSKTAAVVTSSEAHRRQSENHSPSSSSSRHKERNSQQQQQHRVSSSSSRRDSHEHIGSSRNDERSQRTRISGNVDRRNGVDVRNSRRLRRTPRSSDSSDSSHDSPSPSGLYRHHSSSGAPSVPSTVVKLKTGGTGRKSEDGISAGSCDVSGTSASSQGVQSPSMQGMQGIYVSNLPSSRSESSLRDYLIQAFKKFGKVIHIVFEMEAAGPNAVEQRRALILFQRLADMDRLLNDTHHLLGLRLRIRLANHVVVTEVYNNFLAAASAQASGLSPVTAPSNENIPTSYSRSLNKESSCKQDNISLSHPSFVDVFDSKASRTLYVGSLERHVSEDFLRSRFGHFGHILDVDVKNGETPSPFAFIQYADIQSVVRAINAYRGGTVQTACAKSRVKTNWGRTIVCNKIWLGGLPSSCSSDYIREKMRVSFTESFNEVIYDPRWNEALLLFSSNENAQRAFSMIKTKQIAFWNADEKRDVHVPVDYCSEKLHDYFVDRKFRGDRESGNPGTAFSSVSANANIASTSILAPPPDPPRHLRDTGSPRQDYRRTSAGSGMSKRRRSPSHDGGGGRTQSRSSRYSALNRSRRRRVGRGNQSGSSSSNSSSSESGSSASRSPSHTKRHIDTRPQREQSSSIPSRLQNQRSLLPLHQKCSSPIHSRSLSTDAAPSALSQLLPPPTPSAEILNPVPLQANITIRTSAVEHNHNQSAHMKSKSSSDSSSEVDNEAIQEDAKKSFLRSDRISGKTGASDYRSSRDSGFDDSTVDQPFTTPDSHIISSNRIEEIANTLVNVIEHHSKVAASSSTTSDSRRRSMSRPSISDRSEVARKYDETKNSSSGLVHGGSSSKRTKWPWGNEVIKSACIIPLELSVLSLKDPRQSAGSAPNLSTQSNCNLSIPRFATDSTHERGWHSKRSGSVIEKNGTPRAHSETRRTSRGSIGSASCGQEFSSGNAAGPESSFAALHLVANSTGNSALPTGGSHATHHRSLSRSASSGSDGMLSPDPAFPNYTVVSSQNSSCTNIFGSDGSPTNDSNAALRERIFALGAKFRHVDETFQKTKRTSHIDYERKNVPPQRSHKFEEELERLRAKTSFVNSGSAGGSASSSVSLHAIHSQTNFSQLSGSAGTFAFSRSFSVSTPPTTLVTPTVTRDDTTNPPTLPQVNPLRPNLITIPTTTLPSSSVSAPNLIPSVSTSVQSTTNLPSPPQFPSVQLLRPPIPPNPAVLKQSCQSAQSLLSHVIPFPPNFSVPPPPISLPPIPPLVKTIVNSPVSSIISAPPPPPPLPVDDLMTSSATENISTTITYQAQSASVATRAPPPTTLSQVVQSSISHPPTSVHVSSPVHPAAISITSCPQTSNVTTSNPAAWKQSTRVCVSTPLTNRVNSSTPLSNSHPSASLISVPVLSMLPPKSNNPKVSDCKASISHSTPQRDNTSKPVLGSSTSRMSGSPSVRQKSSKDIQNKSLNDLFRQQAQDASEVIRKKQQETKLKGECVKKVPNEETETNKIPKPPISSSKGERKVSRESETKDENSRQILEKKMKQKQSESSNDGRFKSEEVTAKRKESKDVDKEQKEKEFEGKEHLKEKKCSKEDRERKKLKAKEANKDKGNRLEDAQKHHGDKEKERKKIEKDREKRRKEKEKERAVKEKKKKQMRETSESESDESYESSEERVIHSFDIEVQRLMLEEAASGSLGLSMYDRVKRRSSAMKPDDTAKKNRTLELLREKTQNKKNAQKRAKRVQLESSSDEFEDTAQGGDSDGESSIGSSRTSELKKVVPKKTSKKGKKPKRKDDRCVDSEDERKAPSESEESSNNSERSAKEPKRRGRPPKKANQLRKSTKKSSKARTEKLSLDDVFGTYSTEDESTQQSVSSAKSRDLRTDRKVFGLEWSELDAKSNDRAEDKSKDKEQRHREGLANIENSEISGKNLLEKEFGKEDLEKVNEKIKSGKKRSKSKEQNSNLKKEKSATSEKVKEFVMKKKEGKTERSNGKEQEDSRTQKEADGEHPMKTEIRKRSKKGFDAIDLFGKDSDTEEQSDHKKTRMDKPMVQEISMFPEVSAQESKLSRGASIPEERKKKSAENSHYERKLAKKLWKERKAREEVQHLADIKKKQEVGREEESIEKSVVRNSNMDEKLGQKKNEVRTESTVVDMADVGDKRNCDCENIDTVSENVAQEDYENVDLKNGKDSWDELSNKGNGFEVTEISRKRRNEMSDLPSKRIKAEVVTDEETMKRDNSGEVSQTNTTGTGRTDQMKSPSLPASPNVCSPSRTISKSEESITSEDKPLESKSGEVSDEEHVATPSPLTDVDHVTSTDEEESLNKDDKELEKHSKQPLYERRQEEVSSATDNVVKRNDLSVGCSAVTSNRRLCLTLPDHGLEDDEGLEAGRSGECQIRELKSEMNNGVETTVDNGEVKTMVEQKSSKSTDNGNVSIPSTEDRVATKCAALETSTANASRTLETTIDKTCTEEFSVEREPLPSAGIENGSCDVSSSLVPSDAIEDTGLSDDFEVIDEGRVEVDGDEDEANLLAEQLERDVHDVQETEDAVQSIALMDDTMSHHSGDELGSTGIGIVYVGGDTSRHSSLIEDEINRDGVLTPIEEEVKDLPDESNMTVEERQGGHLDREEEDVSGENMSNNALDKETEVSKESGNIEQPTHIDEIIDDVVASGYVEIDAEQLMRMSNSKRAQEQKMSKEQSLENNQITSAEITCSENSSCQSRGQIQATTTEVKSADSEQDQVQYPPQHQTPQQQFSATECSLQQPAADAVKADDVCGIRSGYAEVVDASTSMASICTSAELMRTSEGSKTAQEVQKSDLFFSVETQHGTIQPSPNFPVQPQPNTLQSLPCVQQIQQHLPTDNVFPPSPFLQTFHQQQVADIYRQNQQQRFRPIVHQQNQTASQLQVSEKCGTDQGSLLQQQQQQMRQQLHFQPIFSDHQRQPLQVNMISPESMQSLKQQSQQSQMQQNLPIQLQGSKELRDQSRFQSSSHGINQQIRQSPTFAAQQLHCSQQQQLHSHIQQKQQQNQLASSQDQNMSVTTSLAQSSLPAATNMMSSEVEEPTTSIAYSSPSNYAQSISAQHLSISQMMRQTATENKQQTQQPLFTGKLSASSASPTRTHIAMNRNPGRSQSSPATPYDLYQQQQQAHLQNEQQHQKQQAPPVQSQEQQEQQAHQGSCTTLLRGPSEISGLPMTTFMQHSPNTSVGSLTQPTSSNGNLQSSVGQFGCTLTSPNQMNPPQTSSIAQRAVTPTMLSTPTPFGMTLPSTSTSTFFPSPQIQQQYLQMCRESLCQQGSVGAPGPMNSQNASAFTRSYAQVFQAATSDPYCTSSTGSGGVGVTAAYPTAPHASHSTTSLVSGSSGHSPLTCLQQHGSDSPQNLQRHSPSVKQQLHRKPSLTPLSQQQMQSFYNGGAQFGYIPAGYQVQNQQVQLPTVSPQNPSQQLLQSQGQVKRKPSVKQAHQQQQQASAGKYPVLWQGIVALKTNEAMIQMHRVGGNVDMLTRSLEQLSLIINNMPAIRINQRMRMEAGQLESVQSKMADEQSYIALICLPCGTNKEDLIYQTNMLNTRFIDYLESKQAAGICNVGNEQHPTPNCIVHMFPPCDFATAFLMRNEPSLLDTMHQRRAKYLFVVITSAG